MADKPKVFDINIFVDIFEKRRGWDSSLELISRVRSGVLQGYVSALSIPLLYFRRLRVSREKEAKNDAWTMVKGFRIVELNASILEKAIEDSKFKDYEDAIQYYCAKGDCNFIITRNKKDFPHKELGVLR